jgi:hypothetical protein
VWVVKNGGRQGATLSNKNTQNLFVEEVVFVVVLVQVVVIIDVLVVVVFVLVLIVVLHNKTGSARMGEIEQKKEDEDDSSNPHQSRRSPLAPPADV